MAKWKVSCEPAANQGEGYRIVESDTRQGALNLYFKIYLPLELPKWEFSEWVLKCEELPEKETRGKLKCKNTI